MKIFFLLLMVFLMSASVASAEVPLNSYNLTPTYNNWNANAVQTNSAVTGQQNSTFCSGATCNYTPLEPFSAYDAKAGAYNNFAYYVNTVFKLLITAGSLFAIVMLVVAGIGYMVSEAAIDIQKAKDRAVAALWGLLLLVGCWLILYTINPNLLNFNLNIPGSAQSSSATPPNKNTASTPSTQEINDLMKNCNGTVHADSTTGNPTCYPYL